MKFMSLFKKELREMVTPQTIIVLIFSYIGMMLLGNVMSDAINKSVEESSKIIICDQDDTEFTRSVIEFMKNPLNSESEKNDVKLVTLESDDYAKELDRLDIKDVVIIPKGFTADVEAGKTAEYLYVDKLTSLSTFSNISVGSQSAQALIKASVTSAMYSKKVAAGQLTIQEIEQFEAPVSLTEKTVVTKNTEEISSSMVMNLKRSESMFLPIIIFCLVIYSSNMLLNAVSTEKIDKTLETLLSAPVSRISVLSSKMLAAGIVAAAYAVVMMLGMDNLSGAMSFGTDGTDYTNQMKALGLSISGFDYILVGAQMFISLLISLALALVLGVLAKDAKSGQSLLLPIQLMAMVPYMVSMMVDVKTLSPVIRYFVYAIPFTHTFMASENIMFGNWALYWGGLIYQLVLLVVCMSFAIHVFTSDKIFTLSLGGGKKKKSSLFGKKDSIDESDQ